MKRLAFAGVLTLVTVAGWLPTAGRAHSAHYAVMEADALVVEFFFTNGTPMAFASVKLFAPGDAEHPYQTARTDESGRFAFVPSRAGAWTLEADDGMGHRREGIVEVTADQVVPPRQKASRSDAP